MRPCGKWSRRSVLAAAVAVAGSSAAVCASPRWSDAEPGPEAGGAFRELLHRAVAGLDMPCNPGEVFLSTEASEERERDVDGLVTSLEDTLEQLRVRGEGGSPGSWSGMDADRLVRVLAEAIEDDFSKDRLCILAGWQVSRTECRLAALKYLWERGPEADAATACRKEPLRSIAPAPELAEIVPPRTFAGEPFTVQPNGQSVVNVYGKGFNPGAKILFGDVALDSALGHSGWMNAYVPAGLFAREGVLDVVVRNPDGETSNVMRFEVVTRPVLPPPKLTRIEPPGTAAGVPFTVQPNGKSVINVYGAGFEPGAEILLGGVALPSSVGNPGWMNAYVPAGLFAREGVLDVVVRNPDEKVSNVMRFEVVSRGG